MDKKTRPTVVFLVICLLCGWLEMANGQAPPDVENGKSTKARKEYQSWIERHASKSLKGLKLVITVISGEEKARAGFGFGTSSIVCTVSVGGIVSFSYISDFGEKGSSGNSIKPADLKRLNDALKELPDDGSRLPPVGQRVLIQAVDTPQPKTRVYDRANAPASILKILRLSQSGIRAQVPKFKPQSQIDARPSEHGGFLSLSPGGKQILFSSSNGPLQIWEPVTHEPLGEIRKRHRLQDAITFNSDGSLAVLRGWGECELVDTKKWQRIQLFAEPFVNRKQQGLFDPMFTPMENFLYYIARNRHCVSLKPPHGNASLACRMCPRTRYVTSPRRRRNWR
jgi:hypothetical protein